MSAIVRFLQGQQAEEAAGARGIERILENVRAHGTSLESSGRGSERIYRTLRGGIAVP